MASVSWQLDLTRQSTGAAECAGHALGNDDRGTLLPAQFRQFLDGAFDGNGGESGEFLRRLAQGIGLDLERQRERADRCHELGFADVDYLAAGVDRTVALDRGHCTNGAYRAIS